MSEQTPPSGAEPLLSEEQQIAWNGMVEVARRRNEWRERDCQIDHPGDLALPLVAARLAWLEADRAALVESRDKWRRRALDVAGQNAALVEERAGLIEERDRWRRMWVHESSEYDALVAQLAEVQQRFAVFEQYWRVYFEGRFAVPYLRYANLATAVLALRDALASPPTATASAGEGE